MIINEENYFKFPKDFMWGASSSAYQVEGGAQEDGKKLSQQDIINSKSSFCDANVASDFYHRYKEDIQLMKELGMTAYRFSISWPRVLPDGIGVPNSKGIQFYHNVIDELIANGIEPIITMYHYDLPWTLVEKYGGWLNRQVVDDFGYYVRLLMKEYGKKVKYWITINEQDIIFRAWMRKNYVPDQYIDDQKARFQMNHHYTMAHHLACKIVHEMAPGAKVGAVPSMNPAYPFSPSDKDHFAARVANLMRIYFFTDPYIKGVYPKEALKYLEERGLMFEMLPGDAELMKEGYSDFLAVNYYKSNCAKYCAPEEPRSDEGVNLKGQVGAQTSYEAQPGLYKMCKNPTMQYTKWDWAIDPKGLEYILLELEQRYGMPMMIAENGIGSTEELTSDGHIHDTYRISYLNDHIKAIGRAIDKGVNLFAYCPWSFTDLMSTTNGYTKRYGFVYVNRDDKDIKDLVRYKKDSYYWYQNVIETNGSCLWECEK